MPKVRTTIEPEKELDVSENELTDLRALGLLLETNATTPEGVRRAAEKKTAPDNTQEG